MTEIDSESKAAFVWSSRGQLGGVSQNPPGAAQPLDLSLTTTALCLECVLCPEKARKPVIVGNIRDLPFKVAIHPRQTGDPQNNSQRTALDLGTALSRKPVQTNLNMSLSLP